MGRGIFKGNTKRYRSIGQNIAITMQVYQYRNGYFGKTSPSTGLRTRNIYSADNLRTAMDFYNKIALGGRERIGKNGQLRITTMADGSIITMRTTSNSDGTPVVEINIENSRSNCGIKKQKIHFVLEEPKK